MSFRSGVKDSDGESEGGDCDEVICEGRGEPGMRLTKWRPQVMHI